MRIEGRSCGHTWYHQDITELKQAEKDVQEAHRLLSDVIDGSSSPIFLKDREGRFITINTPLEKMLGMTREDLKGKTDYDIATKELADYWGSHDRQVITTGRPLEIEEIADLPDGHHIFLANKFPLVGASGEIYGVGAISHDITDRKRAEEALKESESKYRNLFANMTEEVHFWELVRDEEGRIKTWRLVDANPPTLKSWGRTLEEIKGKTTDEIFGSGAKDHYMSVVQKIMDEGVPHSFEDYFPNLDKYFRFTSIPLGEYFITTGADITILKRAEDLLKLRVEEQTAELRDAYAKLQAETEERQRTEDQLRQAQKMEALGTLSGGIAHDFNNILAAIIGFTELLEGHIEKGGRDARHVKRILEGALRGRELVKQMLTFSRKTEAEKKPLRLSSVVKEISKFLRASTPTTISIRTTVKSESGVILGDPVQLQQVLMNLCTNAVYAMHEKGGVLDIELSDFSVSASDGNGHGVEPGLYMKLVVRDTGAGISPDIMDKIFDPFFTTKKLGDGTGLGLSVVHGIVKQSNGYITAESEPGKGSTFSVYFPKATETVAPDYISAEDTIPTGAERVLFVDDEEALVEMGEDILAELGYQVTSRMNGREALSLLKEDPSRFDLVISDQTMPDMTGIELAKEILAVRADMPIILCTGFSHLVDADKAKAAGIRAFAMKPLTKREIARTIRKVLDERATLQLSVGNR